jgi:prevent-host-death family protein
MKTATAKELRIKASSILEEVKKGNEVVITMRGQSIAVIKPLKRVKRLFNPVGFGIWKDRKDIADVQKWIDERRKERFQR